MRRHGRSRHWSAPVDHWSSDPTSRHIGNFAEVVLTKPRYRAKSFASGITGATGDRLSATRDNTLSTTPPGHDKLLGGFKRIVRSGRHLPAWRRTSPWTTRRSMISREALIARSGPETAGRICHRLVRRQLRAKHGVNSASASSSRRRSRRSRNCRQADRDRLPFPRPQVTVALASTARARPRRSPSSRIC